MGASLRINWTIVFGAFVQRAFFAFILKSNGNLCICVVWGQILWFALSCGDASDLEPLNCFLSLHRLDILLFCLWTSAGEYIFINTNI